MDRIEATEKARVILGRRYCGVSQHIDWEPNGIEVTAFSVFYRSQDGGMICSDGPTWESMIENLETAMAVSR